MATACVSQSFARPFGVIDSQELCHHFSALDCVYDLGVPPKLRTLLPKLDMAAHVESGAFGSTLAMSSSQTGEIWEQIREPSKPTTLANMDTATNNQEPAERNPDQKVPSTAFAPEYDTQMDPLITRINENVVIRDMPIENPRTLEVPRGYSMEMEIQPSYFFKIRAKLRTEVKKRKRGVDLPTSSRRGWRTPLNGFRPEEVNWNGAIGLGDCQPSTLTNDIHPLFDRDCFDDTPDAIYDQLIPGLQLATLFLTQPICMQFWVTLAMGHRRNDPEMSARNGRLSQRIDSHVALTAERARTVIEHINNMGKSKLIHFRFKRGLQALGSSAKGQAYAVSLPICDYKGIEKEYHGVKDSLVRSIIRLHADYYVVAKKLSQLKYQEVSQKLRFNFGFAVLMVHEVAHSIEGVHFRNRANQWIDWQTSRYYREPYWLDWDQSECGRAWEETMFGGHIQPINGKVDGSHGIGVADWPFGGADEDPKNYRWWTVPMDYIEHMFQVDTWQRTFDLKHWRVFNIPRDGASSLYINQFTTMDPSEEWRVAKEELAEVIARSGEEPAKKKRVKGTGKTEEKRPDEGEVIDQAVVEGNQTAAKDATKRQDLMFPCTRRLSSVMPGALPGSEDVPNTPNSVTLTPHTRKPSLNAPNPGPEPWEEREHTVQASAKVLSEAAPEKDPHVSSRYTPRQRRFLEDQWRKDQNQCLRDEVEGKIIDSQRPRVQGPTPELGKRIKTEPKGIGEKYRRRKKTQATLKRADKKKKMESIEPGISIQIADGNPMPETVFKEEQNEVQRTEANGDLSKAAVEGPSAETEKQRAIRFKEEVENRERQRRRNRPLM